MNPSLSQSIGIVEATDEGGRSPSKENEKEVPNVPNFTKDVDKKENVDTSASIDDIVSQITKLSIKKSDTEEDSKVKTAFTWDSRCLKHEANRDHLEKPERVVEILNEIKHQGLFSKLQMVEGRLASKEELCREEGGYGPHTKDHVKTVDDSVHLTFKPRVKSEDDPEDSKLYPPCHYIDSDTYVNEYSNIAARTAVGCVLNVTKSVLEGSATNGFAAIRPPGHHAGFHNFSGFCLYNNVAAAAKYAKEKFPEICKKILILDWDVHHGDGTQQIFYEDPSVLFISIHRFTKDFFPCTGRASEVGKGRGKGYNINIPLEQAGLGNQHYAAVFKHIVIPVAQRFSPDLILISAGFDCVVGDPVGGMNVTPEGLKALTEMLMAPEIQKDGRIVMVLEGGYNTKMVAKAATRCLEALMGHHGPQLDPISIDRENTTDGKFSTTIQNCLRVHSRYWPLKYEIRRSSRRPKKA